MGSKRAIIGWFIRFVESETYGSLEVMGYYRYGLRQESTVLNAIHPPKFANSISHANVYEGYTSMHPGIPHFLFLKNGHEKII